MQNNILFLEENDNFSEQFKIYIYSDIDTLFPLLNTIEVELHRSPAFQKNLDKLCVAVRWSCHHNRRG
jgi:hypothetical protein